MVVTAEKKQVTFGELVGRCLAVLAVAVGIRVGVALVCQPAIPPAPPATTPLEGKPKERKIDFDSYTR